MRKITASFASHSRAAFPATTSNTGCRSVGESAITRRISLVAVCSRSRDSSCSVRCCTTFLGELSWLARGFFFFFEAPSRAMGILLTPGLEDFQRPTLRRRRSSRMKSYSDFLPQSGCICPTRFAGQNELTQLRVIGYSPPKNFIGGLVQ